MKPMNKAKPGEAKFHIQIISPTTSFIRVESGIGRGDFAVLPTCDDEWLGLLARAYDQGYRCGELDVAERVKRLLLGKDESL